VESRLVPVNAILDLALADGLNPAPLADAGWAVAALECRSGSAGSAQATKTLTARNFGDWQSNARMPGRRPLAR
jgi:hypothetical protein